MLERLSERNYKLLVVTVFIAVLTLATAITTFATAPSVYLYKPGYVGFYMLYESMPVEATITNSPTSVKLYWNDVYKKNLSLVSGTTYGTNWAPTTNDQLVGVYNNGIWSMSGKIKVTAQNSDGTSYAWHAGQVSFNYRFQYEGNDYTWFYNNSTSHSFMGVPTEFHEGYHGDSNTYNCLAYCVGNLTSWQWPDIWDQIDLASIIGKNHIKAYMSKSSCGSADYTNRPGSLTYSNVRTSYQPWTTKVIYYSGKHFAKVIQYDANGYPDVLYSKWGHIELMKSTDMNCFAYGSYESPYYYID